MAKEAGQTPTPATMMVSIIETEVHLVSVNDCKEGGTGVEETYHVTAGVMVKQFAIPIDNQSTAEMQRLIRTSGRRPTRAMIQTEMQLEMRPRTIPRIRKMIDMFGFMLMSWRKYDALASNGRPKTAGRELANMTMKVRRKFRL